MNKIQNTALSNINMRDRTLSFFGQNQYKDWRILLSLLFLGFFLAVIFATYSFFTQGDEIDFFSNSTTINSKKINKEVLTSMLSGMEERQKNLESLRINKPVVGDPSI
jgi:hypothetical protein